jgi:hypothetical protein
LESEKQFRSCVYNKIILLAHFSINLGKWETVCGLRYDLLLFEAGESRYENNNLCFISHWH